MYKTLVVIIFVCLNYFTFAQTFSLAESVEYDSIGNRFLASSSANSSIVEIDLAGNLSLFGNGLQGHLGMEIIGNYLFAIVGTGNNQPVQMVKAYDLTTEVEVMSLTISTATVLNGMASDGVSKLWVTDLQDSDIYEIDVTDISQPQSQLLIGNTDIPNQPNGITYDQSNNRLVFVSWNDGKIRQVDLSDNSISEVFDSSLGNMDGIDMDEEGNFYVSSWAPLSRITKFSNDFSSSEIINVSGILILQISVTQAKSKHLRFPSFQHNVIFWSLAGTTSTDDFSVLNQNEVKLFPNPTRDIINIEIPELTWKKLHYIISSINGNIIMESSLTNNSMKQIPLDLSNLPNNQYVIKFIFDEELTLTDKIILSK